LTARPRFGFPAAAVRDLLRFLVLTGHAVSAIPLPAGLAKAAPDHNDLPFAETALAASAQALVTGNARHFAFLANAAVRVPGPQEFLWFWET
jgi:predicted nucleic acid-binding protein